MCKLILLTVLFLSVGSSARTETDGTAARPTWNPEKTVLAFVAQEMFSDETLEGIRRKLGYAGYRMQVAAPDSTVAVGMDRTVIKPNLTLAEVESEDFAALVLINGSGIVLHWDDSLLHARCRDFIETDKLVAAIGIAPICLARAGALAGYKATVFPDHAAVRELTENGARFVPNPIVEDRSILTASEAQYVRAFGKALVAWLERR